MKKEFSFLGILLPIFFGNTVYAQLKVDLDMRSRAEYRHGYLRPMPKSAEPAFFVNQRTCLNIGYQKDKLSIFLSGQDVRIWGTTPYQTGKDNNFSIYQAWAKYNISSSFAFKLGRQEINYDDGRILGNNEWLQQGLSHDAIVFQFHKKKYKIDVGATYNRDRESLTKIEYYGPSLERTMQYLWFNRKSDKLSASILFLNNGLELPAIHIDSTIGTVNPKLNYHQTVGTHLEYQLKNLLFSANGFYQFGKNQYENKISSFLIGLDAKYAPEKSRFEIGLGAETRSGTDVNKFVSTKRYFTTSFSSYHKFNGSMDYFSRVAGVQNNGLNDLYLNAAFKPSKEIKIALAYHNFSTVGKVYKSESSSEFSNALGNEIDLELSYKLSKVISVNAGYSHMFTTKALDRLIGFYKTQTSNWAWLSVSIKPTLLIHKFKETGK